MIGDFLEKYTFDYLMNDALSRVNENIDTREGSIIYDALAPACYELAGFYLQLKNLLLDTFPQTAVGQQSGRVRSTSLSVKKSSTLCGV